MSKKFSSNNGLLPILLSLFSISLIITISVVILYFQKEQIILEILFIFLIIFWSCSFFLFTIFLLNYAIVEISEKGILYRKRKLKRFLEWEEVCEIEIIKLKFLNLKQIFFTRTQFNYGHKLFLNMNEDPDIIIINSNNKKLLKEIKKYHSKEIICGRNFKIAIAQEEEQEQGGKDKLS